MKRILLIFEKAKHSGFYLFLLNTILGFAIPFNKPHRIKISGVHEGGVDVRLPYRRKNLNHLKGIHACALATAAEYSSGISLLLCIGTDYRLIMKNISITYHYQAKMDVVISHRISKEIIENNILLPLGKADSILFHNTVDVYDVLQNHLCTTTVDWQIKKWDKVKSV